MSCSSEAPGTIQSKITEGAVTCPSCRHTSQATMWDVLEAKCNPERAGQLATGELLVHRCPECGVLVPLDYPLFYIDRDRQVAVYYPAGKGELDAICTLFVQANQRFAGIDLVSLRKKEFELRVAPTRYELAEKVTAWRAALNDKVLEVFKAVLLRELNARNPEAAFCEIQLTGVKGESPEQKLEFTLFVEKPGADGKPEVVPAGAGVTMPRAAYAQLGADIDVRCEIDRRYTPVVNAAWAQEILAAIEKAQAQA